MIHFEYHQKGHEGVTTVLRDTARRAPKEMSDTTFLWAARHALPRLQRKPYPPERPRQTYVRTGKLGRGWNVRPTTGGATIFNNRPGVIFATGDGQGGGQAWMHVGRWWRAADIIRNERKTLGPMLVKRLNKMLTPGAGQ